MKETNDTNVVALFVRVLEDVIRTVGAQKQPCTQELCMPKIVVFHTGSTG